MGTTGHRYFVVHKPRKMVSQFLSAHKVKLLGDLSFDFPEGTHAIGRLDNNSEGILLLTTNKRVTSLLFQGETAHKRVYVVLVTGLVTDDTLVLLRNGVTVQDKDSTFYTTSPCEVELITKPPYLHDDKYIYREKVPHSWLQITLTEGKYHQVRKMVAAAGHQCMRLIRIAIEDIFLDTMPVGSVREMEEDVFFEALRIDNWKPTYDDADDIRPL